jgi:hypothetical protein
MLAISYRRPRSAFLKISDIVSLIEVPYLVDTVSSKSCIPGNGGTDAPCAQDADCMSGYKCCATVGVFGSPIACRQVAAGAACPALPSSTLPEPIHETLPTALRYRRAMTPSWRVDGGR